MNTLLIPEIRQTLARGDCQSIREFAEDLHPATVAEFVGDMQPADLNAFLACLPPLERGEVFSYLETPTQVRLAHSLKRDQLAELVTHMSPDERADLVKRLKEETLEALWPALAQAEREDIRRLSSYEEGTAGAVMTSDYVTLLPHLTAREAIDKIRREAPDRETVYYAYVVTPERRLVGSISLKDLILARPASLVEDLMAPGPISAPVSEDQEEVARSIEKYDLLALPVVDRNNALVGIVTHDDAFDILREEQTEDLERIMGITGETREEAYLDIPSSIHYRKRVTWCVALAALQLVSGWILHTFQGALTSLMLLVVYLPMLASVGGNTGSQASTMVIRALALEEVEVGDVLRILWKELRVSLLLGLTLGVLAYGKVVFLTSADAVPAGHHLGWIGATVALALGLQVVSSTIFGAVLPLAASKLRLDPAVVASPALSTIVDITGLLLYFGLATWLLNL